MPQYALRLPDDLYQRATALAREQGVSLNQFLLYAVADMVSAVEARHFLDERRHGLTVEAARKQLSSVLSRVPAAQPHPGDELPPG